MQGALWSKAGRPPDMVRIRFTNPAHRLNKCSMNVLVWFKRDLRVQDHPALALAAGLGPVLPLYIAEPEAWAQPDASARQWGFVGECLEGLRRDLAQIGAPLAVRNGEAVAVLDKICRAHNIRHILSHEETGTAWSYARDRRVAAWARAAGITWQEVAQSAVVRRLPSRNGWQRQRDGFMAQDQAQVQGLTAVAGVESGVIASARAMRLAEDPAPARQIGGRARGLDTLESFLATRGAPYRAAMASPLSGERACSRLSPYIAVGALSLREVVQATTARQDERPGGAWSASLRSFQSRLAWRDHFIQKLEDAPDMDRRALDAKAGALRVSQAARLAAWDKGQTGLPFIDACLRYLAATGWLNFRARAMVMSFASYHLWLDWRDTGKILARRFTDYEPGIHWPQVQMQSGVTGINTPRIYNPIKQGLEQDPTGAFTRRWLPELAAVPDGFLQEPWKWPAAQGLLGRRYPEPLIDPTAAARAARDAIWSLRRTPEHRSLAALIAAKHASRKGAHQVIDAPRAKQGAAGQLSFDL